MFFSTCPYNFSSFLFPLKPSERFQHKKTYEFRPYGAFLEFPQNNKIGKTPKLVDANLARLTQLSSSSDHKTLEDFSGT
jgi:hypothetical protein